MLDATAALLTYQAASTSRPAARRRGMGNRHPTIVPYDTFAASDGDFVLAVGNDEQWRRFCRIARPRVDRRATSASRPTARACATTRRCGPCWRSDCGRARDRTGSGAEAAGVPCGSVRSVGEVLQDRQLTRGTWSKRRPRVGGSDSSAGGADQAVRHAGRRPHAPPALGQHTDRILREDCGLTAEDIDALRVSKTI